jgi:hypothetical protein
MVDADRLPTRLCSLTEFDNPLQTTRSNMFADPWCGDVVTLVTLWSLW